MKNLTLQILVDWAFQQLDETGIVGTHGESLGAATTLQHAAIDKRISFAIADCPFSDLTELLKYRFKEDYHLPALPFALTLPASSCQAACQHAIQIRLPHQRHPRHHHPYLLDSRER